MLKLTSLTNFDRRIGTQMKFLKKTGDGVSKLKAEHTVFRVLLNKYFIATMVFLVWVAFFDSNSVVRWVGVRKTLHEQKAQIRFYEKEISATESKINYLKSEKDSLEKFAREEYHYHEDGEDVYLIEVQ